MPDRPKRWRYSPAELEAAVRQSTSLRQVLTRLGLSNQGGGSYGTIKRRIAELALDTSHLTGQGWNTGLKFNPGIRRTRPLSELLVQDSPVTSMGRLKKRLIAAGMLEECCQICSMNQVWQGKPLVLRMDHINGVRSDCRVENLRLICPNCDSQLPTFAGRNIRRTEHTQA